MKPMPKFFLEGYLNYMLPTQGFITVVVFIVMMILTTVSIITLKTAYRGYVFACTRARHHEAYAWVDALLAYGLAQYRKGAHISQDFCCNAEWSSWPPGISTRYKARLGIVTNSDKEGVISAYLIDTTGVVIMEGAAKIVKKNDDQKSTFKVILYEVMAHNA